LTYTTYSLRKPEDGERQRSNDSQREQDFEDLFQHSPVSP
jgi:hypothetical protein